MSAGNTAKRLYAVLKEEGSPEWETLSNRARKPWIECARVMDEAETLRDRVRELERENEKLRGRYL